MDDVERHAEEICEYMRENLMDVYGTPFVERVT